MMCLGGKAQNRSSTQRPATVVSFGWSASQNTMCTSPAPLSS